MWETVDSVNMKSIIPLLHGLADFDTSAPITTTVVFLNEGDENNDVSYKSRNVREHYTSQHAITANQLDVIALEVKKELIEEPKESSKAITELNFDKQMQQNALKESITHQADDSHNKMSITDDSRKRKQRQLQIYKNQKAAKRSAQNPVNNNLCAQNNLNADQSEISIPTSENSVLESNKIFKIAAENLQHLKSTARPSDPSVSLQNNVDPLTRTETCLSSVSEHMRHIMEAFYHQRQHKTFKEEYKRIKNKRFSLSYNTVVEKILPEEKNTQFIKDFVKVTHLCASEKSSYRCFCQDYEILLRELLTWARNKMQQTNKTADINKTSEQANLSGTNIDEKMERPSAQNNDVKSNNCKTTDADGICIFSAGSPGREISINVDPRFQPTAKEIMEVTVIPLPNESKGGQQQLNNLQNNLITSSEIHENKLNQMMAEHSVQQPTIINTRNTDSNGIQESFNEILKNCDAPSQPLPRLPQILKPLEMQHFQPPSVQSQFGQSTYIPTQHGKSSLVLPLYSQSTNLQQQLRQLHGMQQQYRKPPPYNQLTNLQQQLGQPQLGQSQLGQSQLGQSQLGQSQLLQRQHRKRANVHSQYQQPHVQIHHGQLQHVQPQLGQSQPLPEQYRQSEHVQSQYGLFQHLQRPYGQSQPAVPQFHPNDMQRDVLQSQQAALHYARLHHLPPQNAQPNGGRSQPLLPQYPRQNVGQSQSAWTYYEQSPHRLQRGQTKPDSPQIRQLQPVQPHQSHHLLPHHEKSKYFPPQAGQSQHVLASYDQADCLKSLFEKRLEWHQENHAIYNQGNIQTQNQKSSPRSASTDSGFISPLNFNVSAEQTVVTPDSAKAKEHAPIWDPPSEPTETPSLLITHVTSLNPGVAHIEEGNCIVCNKRTKQMCMGCMKYYYCNYECQLQDWSTHEPNCKMNNNSSS